MFKEKYFKEVNDMYPRKYFILNFIINKIFLSNNFQTMVSSLLRIADLLSKLLYKET